VTPEIDPEAPEAPPDGLEEAGRSLWTAVLDDWQLETHERALLLQACQTLDLVDELQATLEADGAMVATTGGTPRTHPAAVEVRQQRIALARILAALRLPDGVDGDESQGRRQRRAGVRGVRSLRQAS